MIQVKSFAAASYNIQQIFITAAIKLTKKWANVYRQQKSQKNAQPDDVCH